MNYALTSRSLRKSGSKDGRECVDGPPKEASTQMQRSRELHRPCIIGNTKFENVMLDLGASIDVMPLSIYEYLNLGPLREISIIIELFDRSNVYPKGILDDV